jgi:hypothetical protein
MAKEPEYELSRAAQRKIYGTRKIDASAPQSQLDTTPSGKVTRMQQAGMNPEEIKQSYAADWKAQFAPVSTLKAGQPIFSRRAMQAPGLAAAPAPMNPIPGQQTLFGPDQLPPQKPLGLIPPGGDLGDLGDLMPTSVGPLSSFALPKPTVLSSGSKWSRPSFG